MSPRATYRFRSHTLRPDNGEGAEPVRFHMECKRDGETSEPSTGRAEGTNWAVEHLKANPGHLTYRERITRSYAFVAGAWY